MKTAITVLVLTPLIVLLHLAIEESIVILTEPIKEYRLYVLWVGAFVMGIVCISGLVLCLPFKSSGD
jgi:hypothetical protein